MNTYEELFYALRSMLMRASNETKEFEPDSSPLVEAERMLWAKTLDRWVDECNLLEQEMLERMAKEMEENK